MKKILFGIIAAAMAISAEAQTTPVQMNLKTSNTLGRLDMRQHRHLTDQQIAEMTKRVSKNPVTSTDVAAKMLRKALANMPAATKGLKGGSGASIDERKVNANYTREDTVYSEGWESWDGSFKWKPSAWSHQGIAECVQEENICPTWAGFRGDGLYTPYATEGRSYMICDLSDKAQDEWLVSPTIGEISESNYLFFDLGFAPLYTYKTELDIDEEGNIKSIDYDLTKQMYDVEVMVTTKTRSASFNEDDYTVIFKLSEVANKIILDTDLNNREELIRLLITNWHHVRVSLKDFAGQNIRVAFRYKGSNGTYVTLDAVRVSDLLPSARFERPEGTFYMGWGFKDNTPYNFLNKNVFMPAYTESVWPNISNADSESYRWTFSVTEDDIITSDDYDFTQPALRPGQYYWPTLSAKGGSREDVFKGQADVPRANDVLHQDFGLSFVGGNTHVKDNMGVEVMMNVGNFDPTKPYGAVTGPDTNPAFGTPTSSFWAGYGFNQAVGIANVYEKPLKPYVFSSVAMPMSDYLNWGNSKLTCTVYKASETENGGIIVGDDVIAEIEHTDEMALGENGSKGYAIIFNFPEPMIIDSPIAIKISGFNDSGIMSLQPLTQLWNHDNDKGYAFVLLRNQETGGIWWCEIAGAIASMNTAGNMAVSHCIGMNAVFPFLKSVDGDEFHALESGEKRFFEMNTYWAPKKNDDKDLLNGWEIECSDSWITAEIIISDTENRAGVEITANALPDGMEGRVGTVKVKGVGCEETITVSQGNVSAIDNVVVSNNVIANRVYNIAGQTINSVNAKHGLFIENREGKFVKVLK